MTTPTTPDFSDPDTLEAIFRTALKADNVSKANGRKDPEPDATSLQYQNVVWFIFWSKVRKTDGCWMWRGKTNRAGYAMYSSGPAYRIAYEMLKAPIPAGYELDHLCHSQSDCRRGTKCPHRRCVNPDHLEPVTVEENRRRAKPPKADYCSAGHPFASNSRRPSGVRRCRTCAKEDRPKRRAGHGRVQVAQGVWHCQCGAHLGHSLSQAIKAMRAHRVDLERISVEPPPMAA